MIRREAAAVWLVEGDAVADADQRVVRLVHRTRAEEHVVGGHQRQVLGVGKVDQGFLDPLLVAQAMALDLDVGTPGKSGGHAIEDFGGLVGMAFEQRASDRAVDHAGEEDQSLCMVEQEVERHLRRHQAIGVAIRTADQLEEVGVTRFVLHQQQYAIRIFVAVVAAGLGVHQRMEGRDVEDRADDRLDARVGAVGRELRSAEHVAKIGDRNRRKAPGFAQAEQLLHLDRAGRQGIGGMDAQVDEVGGHSGRYS